MNRKLNRLFITCALFFLQSISGWCEDPIHSTADMEATTPKEKREARSLSPEKKASIIEELKKNTPVHPLMIVIKLDDFKVTRDEVPKNWIRIVENANEKKIKINIGVIAEFLETKNTPKVCEWMKAQKASGTVEFWFHALTHLPSLSADGSNHNEFFRPYEEQVKIFTKCQQLAQTKLGFNFSTFGPPGTGVKEPAYDANTARIMQEDPSMKVWLYSEPMDEIGAALEAQKKVTVLDRVWRVNIESPLFVPNCDMLLDGLFRGQKMDRPYYVLQGHGMKWDEERLQEYFKMIDLLLDLNCKLVTATECAEAVKKSGATASANP